RRQGAVEVSRDVAYKGHRGQRPCQPGPVVECPGEDRGLTREGEAPPMLAQLGQWVAQREAELDGPHLGIAMVRQVRECLEGLLERGQCLAERGAVVGPG